MNVLISLVHIGRHDSPTPPAAAAVNARRRWWLSWLVTAPLMAAGSVAAHWIGAVLIGVRLSATAEAGVGEAAEGHARTAGSPWLLALGLLGAIAVVAGVRRLTAAGRAGVGARRRLAGWLLWLPPLAFTLQELTERLAHAESVPFNPALEPRFLIGLALQVPFGLLAFLLGRVLVRVAVAIAGALAARRPVVGAPAGPTIRLRPVLARRRIPVVALGHTGRGPPGC